MSKKYLKQLTTYAGIAILFVVILHSFNHFLNFNKSALKIAFVPSSFEYLVPGYNEYFIKMLVNILEPLPVPIFIFIAGYKYALNDKTKEYKFFVRNKLNKVFKPFIYLTILFILLQYLIMCFKYFVLNTKVSLNVYFIVKKIILAFAGYNYAYQLWYIPMYLFIVLTYPLILKYVKNSYLRNALFLVLALGATVCIQNISIFNRYFYPIGFLYYFYLYEIGIQFSKLKFDKQKKVSMICLGLYIVSLFTSIFTFNYYVYIVSRWILIPFGVIGFYYISCLLCNLKTLKILGKYSFYIYLFHEPIYLSRISNILNKQGINNIFIMIIIPTILDICLSLMTYFILIHIKNKIIDKLLTEKIEVKSLKS